MDEFVRAMTFVLSSFDHDSRIENPGEVSATEVFTVPVPSNWPMTIAALALLLDMPPAPPKSLVPGLCRAADYST